MKSSTEKLEQDASQAPTPKKRTRKPKAPEIDPKDLASFYQFKVKADLGRDQNVWIRILLPLKASYYDLYRAIDDGFGLSRIDYHLHYFSMGKSRNSLKILHPELDAYGFCEYEDEIHLKDIVAKKFYLIWDLGDKWWFTITTEKFLQAHKDTHWLIKKEGTFDPYGWFTDQADEED